MDKILKTVAVLFGLALAAFTSCDTIYDDLPPCEEGLVRVQVYVERFLGDITYPAQAPSKKVASRADYASSSETGAFGERIKSLNYYLYRDDMLVERGQVSGIDAIAEPYYVFQRKDLPFGDYVLVFTGNCEEKAIRGDFSGPAVMTMAFQENEDEREDCFVNVFEFSVRDNSCSDYTTQLKRVHGVVRYSFNNVDPDIKAIEVTMDGLTCTSCVTGTYSDDYTFVKRIPVNQPARRTRAAAEEVELLPNEPTVVGLFPTAQDGVTSWNIKLYKEDGETVQFSTVVNDDLQVVRNDLLDLAVSFENGMIMLYVNMNLIWQGNINVDGTIVN